jgi:hypothetical protein
VEEAGTLLECTDELERAVDDARVEEWEALALESVANNIISTGFAKKIK